MANERRLVLREGLFEVARVLSRDSLGALGAFPVMIRDLSDAGMGAVFVGPAPPSVEGQYYLERGDGSLERMRLVWVAPIANRVYNLGFQFCSG